MWTVVFHTDAETELERLPAKERVAVLHAVEKLAAVGPALPFPHQSNVKAAERLRELRPRVVEVDGERCTAEPATSS